MQNFLSEMTSHAIFQKIRYFLIIDPAARSNDAFKMRGIRDPKKTRQLSTAFQIQNELHRQEKS